MTTSCYCSDFENREMYRAYVGVSSTAAALTALLIIMTIFKVRSHNTNMMEAACAGVFFLMGRRDFSLLTQMSVTIS